MKASIVYNTKEEPRVFIEFENATERRLMRKVDSLRLLVTGGSDDLVTDMAFEIVNEKSDEANQRF